MNNTLTNFFYKDKNNELGFIRLTFGIIGSLACAYFTIMYISKQLHFTTFENIVIGIILLPLFWSLYGLWIVMSKTKFISVLKTITTLFAFYILLYLVH